MAKRPPAILDDPRPPRRSLAVRLLRVATVLALMPLVWEAGQLWTRGWARMSGRPFPVRTPVLDALVARFVVIQSWSARTAGAWVRDTHWTAGSTIALTLVWALAATWLLRSQRQ